MSIEIPKFEITDKQKEPWPNVRVFELTPEGLGEEWHISKFVNSCKPISGPLTEEERFSKDFGKPKVEAVLLSPEGPDGKFFARLLPTGELLAVDPIVPVTPIGEVDVMQDGKRPVLKLTGTIKGHKKVYDGTIRKD